MLIVASIALMSSPSPFQPKDTPVAFSVSGSVLQSATNAVKQTFLTACLFSLQAKTLF
jgi:hypothetical protein